LRKGEEESKTILYMLSKVQEQYNTLFTKIIIHNTNLRRIHIFMFPVRGQNKKKDQYVEIILNPSESHKSNSCLRQKKKKGGS
jgi:hypothetical protein